MPRLNKLLETLRCLEPRPKKLLAVLIWELIAIALYFLLTSFLKPDDPPRPELACNLRPTETRVLAAIALGSLFLFFIVYRSGSSIGRPFEEPRFRPLTHLSPAGIALLTAGLFIGTMLATSYLTGWSSVWGTSKSSETALHAGKELRQVYELTQGTPGKDQAATSSALFLWATMYAMTITAALVSLWFTAGLWVNCRAKRFRTRLSLWFVVAGLVATISITEIGHTDLSAGFGGLVGAVMLCGTWKRVLGGSPEHLAEMSDALNVVGVAIPLAVAFGACLLLGVLGRERTDKASPVDVVKDIARTSATLDTLLYVGAAALVAGTLQVSALYALTLAHVPTITEVKAKRDICRPSSSESLTFAKTCDDLPQQLQDADLGAPLRQLAKSLTLGFGVCLSVLLGGIYLGAATPLNAYARRLILPTVDGDERAAQDRLVALGIESDLIGKMGRLATTLSPLAAGLISNLFGPIA